MYTLEEQLEIYSNRSGLVIDEDEFSDWCSEVEVFIRVALGDAKAKEFEALGRNEDDDEFVWKERRRRQVGWLRGTLASLISNTKPGHQNGEKESLQASSTLSSTRVFVVHGHDGEAKEAVARLLQKVGLDPIILHEQTNQGRTIIEKLVHNADVGFAVVLLTPDDLGRAAASDQSLDLQSRARQNVILELGYFIGHLGRARVCALHKPGVELPSDFDGVVYIPMDLGEGWKLKLVQELIDAKMSAKIESLVNLRS